MDGIIQIISHREELIALCEDGKLYRLRWGSDDTKEQKYRWYEVDIEFSKFKTNSAFI